MSDYRLGRYQDVLADVVCDAVITDPPFGERTHVAWREGGRYVRPRERKRGDVAKAAPVDYAHWTEVNVTDFVAFWRPRCRGWIVALTSHDLIGAWERAYAAAGLYSFAPVPCVTWGGSIRLGGDGPSSWSVYAVVARPKTRAMGKWGTLPGAYVVPKVFGGGGGGRGKPLDLMRAIVRDYSRPGALVCDPCGGLASTGVAALGMGRRFVGAEMDVETHAKGVERLRGVVPVDLFDPGRATQAGLL